MEAHRPLRIDELFQLQRPARRRAGPGDDRTRRPSPSTWRSDVRSYRDLPLILYHFQTKERDEPRPRAGVLRTREFIMKDAYTFDRDPRAWTSATPSTSTPTTASSIAPGLEWYRVESDVGMMGGSGAHEYMAPCRGGRERGRAAAPATPPTSRWPSADAPAGRGAAAPLDAPEPVDTPGLTTVEQVAGALGVPAGALLKAYPIVARRRRPAARSSCAATTASTRSSWSNTLGGGFRPGRRGRGGRRVRPAPGFIGPGGRASPRPADERCRGLAGLVAGANEPDTT